MDTIPVQSGPKSPYISQTLRILLALGLGLLCLYTRQWALFALVLPFLFCASIHALLAFSLILAILWNRPFFTLDTITSLLSVGWCLCVVMLARFQKLKPITAQSAAVDLAAAIYAALAGAMLLLATVLLRDLPVVSFLAWACSLIVLALRLGLSKIRLPQLAYLLFLATSTLLLVETALRWMPGSLPQTRMFQAHPGSLYRPAPGFNEDVPYSLHGEMDATFHCKHNSLGLRDDEIELLKNDAYRILLLGDSYTYGWCVDRPHLYADHLEQLMRQRLPKQRVEVINAGVGGFGPWQSLSLLRDLEQVVQPNLVVLQTFIHNDLGDSLAREGKRLPIYLQHQELALEKFRHMNRYWEYRVQRKLANTSAVYKWVCEATGEPLFVRFLQRLRVWRSLPDPRVPQSPEGLALYQADQVDWSEAMEEGWTLFQRDVLQIRDFCRDNKIDFAVFNIPFPADAADFLREVKQADSEALFALDKGNQIADDFFIKEQLPHFSLLQEFRQHPEPQSLIARRDGHLNDAGHALVAQAMAKFIQHEIFQR